MGKNRSLMLIILVWSNQNANWSNHLSKLHSCSYRYAEVNEMIGLKASFFLIGFDSPTVSVTKSLISDQ